MAHIFIVDKDDSVRENLSGYLNLSEHEVSEFKELNGLKDAIKSKRPDMLILETTFDDGDGFIFIKEIRQKSNIPVIFITTRVSESDRITGFEVGADDYVIKPFSIKELSLRVSAILKRISFQEIRIKEKKWVLGENSLLTDENAHKAEMNGKQLKLTTAEWKILIYLTSNGGTVVSREQILDRCLEYSFEGYDRTVDTHIKNLRSKLIDPLWIETIRGYGYRFAGSTK
ncbi:MAG: response regulator transcription factor [Spirochaetaceae bacterium]|jgi:DNA-binding response OmpR family regulator|nr:response regulator transcription factor [Spirochaetaceae bacterium]